MAGEEVEMTLQMFAIGRQNSAGGLQMFAIGRQNSAGCL